MSNADQGAVQQAAFERAERGFGGDGFGDEQYASTSYDGADGIGDFFGGRLRARCALIPTQSIGALFDPNDNFLTEVEFAPSPGTDFIPTVPERLYFAPGSVPFTASPTIAGSTIEGLSAGEFTGTDFATTDSGPFTAELGGSGLLFGEIVDLYDIYRKVVVPAPGEMVGRLKIAENNNPIPRDRIVFDYTYFDQVGLTARDTHVHRMAPGFEKTFLHGNASIDVRLPFATTIGSDIPTASAVLGPGNSGLTNTGNTEIGNVSITGKVLLARDEHSAIAIGLQTILPTADDVVVSDVANNNEELIRVESEAVHAMPFLAWQHRPDRRTFYQWYLQYDRQESSDRVFFRGNEVGDMEDADFIYVDFSMGYWLYQNMPRTRTVRHGNHVSTAIDGSRLLTGFAPRFELHYNRSIGGLDSQDLGPIQLGESVDKLETLNLTLGGTVMLGIDKEITLAWGTPLINRDDSDFHNEFRVMFNWRMPN